MLDLSRHFSKKTQYLISGACMKVIAWVICFSCLFQFFNFLVSQGLVKLEAYDLRFFIICFIYLLLFLFNLLLLLFLGCPFLPLAIYLLLLIQLFFFSHSIIFLHLLLSSFISLFTLIRLTLYIII